MKKYEVEVKKFFELKGKIEIPRFQRGLVWGDLKKKEFIKTLKTGLPIGALLLFKDGDKYQIVDGLQRYTTMLDYSKDYFSYIDKSEITDTMLMAVILASTSAQQNFDAYKTDVKNKQLELMRDIIIEKIKEYSSVNPNEKSKKITEALCKDVAVLPKEDAWDISSEVYKIVESIEKNANIDDVEIPLIIFNGSQDELASIFQKLNQEGVRLSKYDVFAATWINNYVTVKNDPKFIDFIIDKYEHAKDESDLEISSYDPEEMKQSGELTVFEYAYALGKALKDKCKKLFPKKADAKVDSIGFLLLAELMGLSYQDMGKLSKKIEEYQTLDFRQLKDSILDAGGIVENYLTPYIESPIKSKGGSRTSLVCHSELQLASYIIVVFKLKYELTPENGLVLKQKGNKELSNVKKYLYRHYLYDILQGYWAGSGDSKLEEIIEEPTTCRYTRDVDRDDFEIILSKWLEESLKRTTSSSVSSDTKLFLNYLLRLTKAFDDQINYDIEHCVPKDVIKKFFHKKNVIVPMSSPCNLLYIPSADNRSKGESTYYQKQLDSPGPYQLNENQLDLLCYPLKKELQFVESTDKLTEENYFSFLKERKKTILSKFMNAAYGDC